MSYRPARLVCVLLLSAPFGFATTGCGQEDVEYKPRAAPSGVKASLPPVPNVPKTPIKSGDAYTVWGASYYLRSRVHHKEVAGKKIKVTGWVTETNLAKAPECAVHEGGKGDPEGCRAAIPAFWVGDTKDTARKDCIRVEGWASNYAQIWDAIEQYEKDEDKKDDEKPEPKLDTYWGVEMPRPLPAKGGKLTVEGTYSTTFVRSTKGTESDPIMGILTYQKIDWLEEPPEKATLPGMKKK